MPRQSREVTSGTRVDYPVWYGALVSRTATEGRKGPPFMRGPSIAADASVRMHSNFLKPVRTKYGLSWDPFAEIAWHPNDGPCFTPVVDICEEDDAVLVRVDLADVRPEDVQIDATDRVLSIRGERRRGRAREHGAFARAFQLPPTLDGRAAIAIMSDGVLTVRIPRRRAPSRETFAA